MKVSFIMFAYVTDHPINTIIPYPGRVFPIAMGFFHRLSGSVYRLTDLDRHGNVVLTGLADVIVERFRDAPPVMVGFDPAISFGAGERIVNDNEQSLVRSCSGMAT
jgi:hypothetical protein